MKHSASRSLAGLALVVCAACAHRAPASATPAPGAAGATATVPCPATTDGAAAVAGWHLVSAGNLAFCLAPQWRVVGQSASLGSATLHWGTGEHPRGRAVVVRTTRVVSTGGSRPSASAEPILPAGTEVQREAEIIGGQRADVWRNRLDGVYHTGAQWASPHVWIAGEASSSSDADAELAIMRTARFATP